jgi:hypothetical protein
VDPDLIEPYNHDIEFRNHIRTSINNAWKKLDKYYTLFNQSAAYIAAVVLHLQQKFCYLAATNDRPLRPLGLVQHGALHKHLHPLAQFRLSLDQGRTVITQNAVSSA